MAWSMLAVSTLICERSGNAAVHLLGSAKTGPNAAQRMQPSGYDIRAGLVDSVQSSDPFQSCCLQASAQQ